MQPMIAIVPGPGMLGGASTPTGCRGEFAFPLDVEVTVATAAEIVVFSTSAEDGSRQDELRHPVTLLPGGTAAEAIDVGVIPTYGPYLGSAVDGTFVAVAEVRVEAEIPLNTISVSLNGMEYDVVDPGRFGADLVLEPGENQILLEVTTPAGTRAALPVSVTYLDDGAVWYATLLRTVDDPAGLRSEWRLAEWLVGEEANAAAVAAGEIQPGESVPNDYFVRDLDIDEVFVLAPQASVFLLNDVTLQLDRYPLDYWAGLLASGDEAAHFSAAAPWTGYWIVVDGDGRIVQVVQQYRP